MSIASRSLGAVVALAALLGMAWASRAPLRVDRSGDAVIRVSFGARPERIESCRRQSNEELAKVAPQMRLRVVCEGVTARYQLEVRRDDRVLLSQVVRGGGLRHDRQLYVSRDLRVTPGRATYSVSLARIDTVQRANDAELEDEHEGEQQEEEELGAKTGEVRASGLPAGRAMREMDERRRRREEAIPPELHLDTSATLVSGEVLLITYDQDKRRLATRQSSHKPR